MLNTKGITTPWWIKRVKTPKIKKRNFIPIYAPLLLGNEKKYLIQCLENTWISPKGNFVPLFEKAFAHFCNSPYAISCSSGTSALFLGLISLGIKKGDEVIVPTLTMISTALAVSYIGAKPVFVDVLLETGNINPEKVLSALTPRTKAIIPVHLYGQPADLSEIHQIAKKHYLLVLEDAAEAIGSKYHGRKIGSTSEISAFSLYINKIVTTGQGGMITTLSKKLYLKLKKLNNYYFSKKRHFWHQKIGYNHRLTNIQAAIGLAQMEKVEELLRQKKQIAFWYKEYLTPLKEYFFPSTLKKGAESNFWMIAYRVRSEKYDIMKLRNRLAEDGIETRPFFIPLHLQPAYRKKEYEGKFPNSEELARTGVLLPCGPGLSKSDVERICLLVKQYFRVYAPRPI